MKNQFVQFGKHISDEDELLVLPNQVAFEHGQWQGFLLGTSWGEFYSKLAIEQAQWMARGVAEENFDYQQIIPWMIFRWNNYYLEIKKGHEGPHTRLYGRYSLGFGGHIFKHELESFPNMQEWVRQRFLTEMNYNGNLKITCLGVVNDNTDELGKNHFGIVYLLDGDSNLIESKKGLEMRLAPLSAFTGDDISYWDRWSQMVYRQMRDLERYKADQGGTVEAMF